MNTKQHSGYFTADGHSLYGTLHSPDGQDAQALALFLQPFGEERKCAHRLLVRLARVGAETGLAAFCFDYSGSGESTGNHSDATLQRWLSDACAALDTARRAVPNASQTVLGARLGANLAVRLAAVREVDRLVLLEPLLTGADYLRDLQRRQQIKAVMSEENAAASDSTASWDAGDSVDFGGFEVSAELATELRALALTDDLATLPATCRVLLTRVSGARRFPPSWQAAVDALARFPDSEARMIRDKPFWGQHEFYESDAIAGDVLPFLTGSG